MIVASAIGAKHIGTLGGAKQQSRPLAVEATVALREASWRESGSDVVEL
jgi:hypothetical protein